jgi:hypothetical protein
MQPRLSHHASKSTGGPEPRKVSSQDHLLAYLHQTIGNQGLQRIFRSGADPNLNMVNKKLKVDSPYDASEIEADRVARYIAEISSPDHSSGVLLENSSLINKDKAIQRKCKACLTSGNGKRGEEQETIADDNKEFSVFGNNNNNLYGSENPAGLLDKLENDHGLQLESPVRRFMDRAFAHDFSDVTIHTSSLSSEAADSLNARAFTVGNDIFFGRGMYSPSSKGGEFLLAHELTHVIQQRPPTSQDSSLVNHIRVEENEQHESDAHAAASAVTQNQPITRGPLTQSAPYSIQGAWYDTPIDWLGSAAESVGEAAVSGAKAVGEAAVYVGEAAVSGAKAVGGAVKAGAVYVGEAAVSGAKALGRGAKAVGELLYDAGVAVADALKLVASLALNPLGIPSVIAGIAWRFIPEGIKTWIINKILDAAIGVLDFIPDMPEFSLIWPFLKHTMIGFLRQARSYDDKVKLSIADRFARLASSRDSWQFLIGYLGGLAHGLWDGISGPFVLLWDIIKLASRLIVFLKNLAVSAVKTAIDQQKRNNFFSGLEDFSNTLNENIEEAIEQLFSGQIDPMKIIGFIIDIYHAALKGAKNIGASISDALLKFLQLPDRQLGHSLGTVAGNVLFEVALVILTSGAYLAKPAIQRVTQWVSRAVIRTAEFVAELLEHLPTIMRGFNALREFAVSNRAMRRIIDGAERLFNLLVDFLKASFGIGSAEKRAARAAETETAEVTERRLGSAFEDLSDEEIETALGSWETPKVTGGRSRPYIDEHRVPTQQRRRLDIEDIPLLGGETRRNAVTRIRQVISRKISDIPSLNQAWDRARNHVLSSRSLTRDNYKELYDLTRNRFWQEVRGDAAASSHFSNAGFAFSESATTAPRLAGVGGDIPITETRVSLDHIREKAIGDNWRYALDADNLRMEFASPNTYREIVQARHPELR